MAHKARSGRRANQRRADQLFHKHRPVPIETQREIAEARRKEREAEYLRQGTAFPTYQPEPYRRAPSLRNIDVQIMLDMEFLRILDTVNREGRRAAAKRKPANDTRKPQRGTTQRNGTSFHTRKAA